MKVICKQNRAINLDMKEVTILNSQETYFPVTKGVEYIVMGLVVYKDTNCIYYLVDNGWGPNWIPYPLFDISHSEFSSNWFVKVFDKQYFGDLFYLSGFEELCNNEDYYDALVEREEWALEIYAKRKYEAQEWYFERG